jgi:glutamate dehydrogenase/leucine dehydrogenase
LFDRGIIYVPDFLANRMGIVNAADEQLFGHRGRQIIDLLVADRWQELT